MMMKQQRGAVRAVLNMSLFVLLLLSGLLCSASGFQRNYYYINQSMTWAAAQSYCRANYIDLSTVDSIDDVNRMINTVNDGYNGSVWIGLIRVTSARWGWSNGDDTMSQFNAWYPGKPDGLSYEHCTFTMSGYWHDLRCSGTQSFLCYNKSAGYIIGNGTKNWTDAQSYCRQYHTDLAIARSTEEQNQITAVIGTGVKFLIGLFYDFWQWSDQWSLFYRNWGAGYTSQSSRSGYCAAMSTVSGKWIQVLCTEQHRFICYSDVKQQTVRFSLSHDGNYNLNNSVLQTAILKKIKEKLKSNGMDSRNAITFRKDEDGEVFHLESNLTVNSDTNCD